MKKKRVLSGVQPTGHIHIGNYLGAIKNWVALQQEYESFFCVVDLHAMTEPHDPAALREATLKVAALYVACGIDPAVSTIFVQSHVRPHTQLAWLLSCVTPLTWLERMIQFKEKAVRQGEEVSTGLLCYPILMASDILLYDTDLVPVGQDQKQHLELTRDIAHRFNRIFGSRKKLVFKIPEPMIPPAGARVMSLTDGTKKMSKSDPAEMSRINLLDSADVIRKKINRCKTDATIGLTFDDPDRPECDNLLTLYQLFTGKAREEVASEFREASYSQFKPVLAEAVIAGLAPIQERYAEVMDDRQYLDSILSEGRQRASRVAEATLARAEESMGMVRP